MKSMKKKRNKNELQYFEVYKIVQIPITHCLGIVRYSFEYLPNTGYEREISKEFVCAFPVNHRHMVLPYTESWYNPFFFKHEKFWENPKVHHIVKAVKAFSNLFLASTRTKQNPTSNWWNQLPAKVRKEMELMAKLDDIQKID